MFLRKKTHSKAISFFLMGVSFLFFSCATTDPGEESLHKGMTKDMVKRVTHHRGKIIKLRDADSHEEWLYISSSKEKYLLFFEKDILINVRKK
jgi:hypothetical protein